MKKIFKYLSIFLLILLGSILLLFALISPIAKYVIARNCVQWTGRQVTAGSIMLNPFNGTVSIKELKIYETDNTHVFFDCHEVYVKVGLRNLLNKIYTIEKVTIDNPEISIIQNKNSFNFDDLVKRFASDTGKQPKPKNGPELQYYITNIAINNAVITYNDVPIHNIFRIHELNLDVPEVSWNKENSKVHIDFNYGTGGSFKLDVDVNLKTLNYNVALVIDKYDLSQYYTPLNSYIKVSSLKGFLNTKMRVHGKLNNPSDFSLICDLNIKDFEMNDLAGRKLIGLKEFSTYVDTINVKDNMFVFRSIVLDRPYIALDELKGGTNFSVASVHNAKQPEKEVIHDKGSDTNKVKRDYTNIFTFLESSVKNAAIDFLAANYHADSIAIRNGEFVFNDLTSSHPFQYKISRINVLTDEIGPNNKAIVFTASAALDDTGRFAMKANLTYDLKRKLFSYKISELDISDISPVAKYVLEKNSVKWTSRKITTGNIKIDPLKGSINIKDLKIYEHDSTNVFFKCNDAFVQVNLTQMLDNCYEVDNIRMDNPEISIVQNGNNFNFDDIVKRFSSTDTTHAAKGPQIHYDIKNVDINNGNITFNNQAEHNIFRVHELNFDLPEFSWNNPVSNLHMDCNYGSGGFVNVDMNVNRTTLRYNLTLSVDSYDISQYYAPLNSFLYISSLKGSLNTKIRLHGKFNHPEHVSGTGYIHINDLEIKDTNKQKVFALGELVLNIDTINVKHGIYNINKLLLDKPFIRFDYLPKGNNISQMIKYTAPTGPVKDTSTGELKPDYSNIFTLIASSVKLMAVNFTNTDYHMDSAVIHNGQFLFNDYTLNIPFHYNISTIDISTNTLNSKTKNIQFNIFGTLADTGKLKMYADVSLDLKNMFLDYELSDLRMTDLNPYTEYYTGTTFLDGYMRYKSTDSVINRYLKSKNSIHIVGVETSEEIEGKPVYDLPVRMAISLLKDANGNLDDPNYKTGPLVGRTLRELIVKTASSPFKSLGKLIDRNPEDLKRINFEYMQAKFTSKQLDKLDDVYKVLKRKKELVVELLQVIDSVEEKSELALFMAKDRYYDDTKHPLEDSLLTKKQLKQQAKDEEVMAVQDTLFDKYLNEKIHFAGNKLMTVEDKCIQLIGDTVLNNEVHSLMQKRNKAVVDFLINKKSLAPDRVKVRLNTDLVKVSHTPEPEFEIKYNVGKN